MPRQLSIVTLLFLSITTSARDLHVDPVEGDDHSATGPFRTISVAVRRALPGDTIHLKPIVYRDYAGFYGARGEPGKPIILDGHGATLEGSAPLDPAQWIEETPGLFRADNLLPKINDAIIQRWFFLWNGRMNHMGRTSKGYRTDLKKPEELKPGEWTFVHHPEKDDQGSFYLKLAPGRSLDDESIFVPVRSAGVQFGGSGPNHNAHLVIRNLTATHCYNDGFNIHGHCEDVTFENIRAIECGDDGISAHETAQYSVNGFISIGNSTGICDTGASQTSYRNVFISDCHGFDLFFLDSGRYSIRDARIVSTAAQPLVITGRNNEEHPCTVELDNVWIERPGKPGTIRVEANAVLRARRVTFENLDFRARTAEVILEQSQLTGEKLELFPDVTWSVKGGQFRFTTIEPEAFSVPTGGDKMESGADREQLRSLNASVSP